MSVAPPSTTSPVEAAAWWLTQQHSGEEWTPAQQSAFEQWLADSADHVRAFERMQQLWLGFDAANTPAAQAALGAGVEAANQRRQSLRAGGRHMLRGGTTLALVGIVAWWGWQSEPVQYRVADYRSAMGEITTVELPDHSRITLGSNSAFNLRYEQGERRIQLVRGDVLVQVAPASSASAHIAQADEGYAAAPQAHPFVVATPNATAQAMGTVYAVRYRQDPERALWPAQGASTQVTVLESTVRACESTPSAASKLDTSKSSTLTSPSLVKPNADCHLVHAGQTTRIDAQGLHPVEAASSSDAGHTPAWARGQLLVDNQPLPQVLQELARHRAGYLWVDAKELAGIRVSGVFDLIDTDRSLRALQETTDVYFEHSTPWTTHARLRK